MGPGWNREEMANHGVAPRTRTARMLEHIAAMGAIWENDEAEFHGTFVDFDPIWSWPKPVQNPLPVYVGGNTENTLKRVIAYGDGWVPNAGRSRLIAMIPEFRRLCAESGRRHLPVTVYGTRPTAEAIAEYEAVGVDRLVFWMPSKPRDEGLRELEVVTEVTRQTA